MQIGEEGTSCPSRVRVEAGGRRVAQSWRKGGKRRTTTRTKTEFRTTILRRIVFDLWFFRQVPQGRDSRDSLHQMVGVKFNDTTYYLLLCTADLSGV
jgi:hypothetical protein